MTLAEPHVEKLLSAEELYKSGKMPEMMQHWYSIRKKYPEDYLLAYRMGDFYEFFFQDAINVSKLLGLTLTKRGSGPSRHPLAGIPHKATQHFKTLVSHGQTVIIVEQLEKPSDAKKANRIVKRGVVRILTPGTIIDDDLLESTSANYICSIFREKKNFGVAFIDVSSADFFATEFYGKNAQRRIWAFITQFSPVECVLPNDIFTDLPFMQDLRENISVILKEQSQYQFIYQNAYDALNKQLKVVNLKGFDLEDKPLAISAAGGLLSFIHEAQKSKILNNIHRIRCIYEDRYMFLDITSQKNLELLRNQSDGGTFGSLFSVLDTTQSPMGTRLLKEYIVQPLIQKKTIDQRLERVQYFIDNYEIRADLREYLKQIGDISRLISRVNYSSTVNARNLLQIKNGLEMIHEIRALFPAEIDSIPVELSSLISFLRDFSEIIELIGRAIHETPPTTITEGSIIKDGYNEQVDEYRDILHNGKKWILKFEEQEKARLGIGNGLKISYNRVLGYYIQITNNAMKGLTLPRDYMQRQTLKGALRFDNANLKEMETKILSAETNLTDLEYKLFQEVREKVMEETLAIQQNAEIIAQLDVYAALAETAQNQNFHRPIISTDNRLVIKQGRHPVVEQLSKERFVPNDTLMDTEREQILIITGPNWSGKSTYLRQTALIVLLAQMGSFVPADQAEIGIIDRIFTRIGASDDLTRGQSTFMLEMNETAQILNYATPNSLIIIDELGRGTGTVDGESISQAVLEYLHDTGIKTLFSTHFHKLINLKLPRVHNYHFKIIEKPDTKKLIFLRQLTDGGTDKSYGIHVAMMAGLPTRVTDRAFDLMENALSLEPISIPKSSLYTPRSSSPSRNKDLDLSPSAIPQMKGKKKVENSSKKRVQTSLFPVKRYDDSELVILLRSLDLNNMTPMQAL
ncbi:MAG: DNA mismatch repair protein MutS, partial [Promethearchaeota archaeon]